MDEGSVLAGDPGNDVPSIPAKAGRVHIWRGVPAQRHGFAGDHDCRQTVGSRISGLGSKACLSRFRLEVPSGPEPPPG